MLVTYLAILATGWLVKAADDRPSRNVHGAVAFIRTGERTPLISEGRGKLSALGAQQMYQLGQQLRGRYIGDEAFDGLGHDPIEILLPDILDADQVHIQTLDKPYLHGSAQALVQGLYPPYSLNSTRNGPIADSTGVLANGTAMDFPMSGYQYAPIKVTSVTDPYSIYISGSENCPVAVHESLNYQFTERYAQMKTASEPFYSTFNTSLFDGIYKDFDM